MRLFFGSEIFALGRGAKWSEKIVAILTTATSSGLRIILYRVDRFPRREDSGYVMRTVLVHSLLSRMGASEARFRGCGQRLCCMVVVL